MSELLEQLRRVTESILDPSRPSFSMRAEVLELGSILETASGSTFRDPDYDIAAGETRTRSGVAISPTMAAMCVEDYLRTIEFIRGLREAIDDLRVSTHDRPVSILYAGCGPFATLAVPLMSLLDANRVRFELLDIHETSIESTRRVVNSLGLSDRISAFEVGDATEYEIRSSTPDIVVVELLRAALEAEPQVAVMKNLAAQAKDALFIPESVSIEFALVNSSKEFSVEDEDLARDRIAVEKVFEITRDGETNPTTITVPDHDSTRYRPMLLTTVFVYGGHVLRDYDAGITCPKAVRVEPGNTVEFRYEVSGSPALVVRKVDVGE